MMRKRIVSQPPCSACGKFTGWPISSTDASAWSVLPSACWMLRLCLDCRESVRNQAGDGWQWLQRMKDSA